MAQVDYRTQKSVSHMGVNENICDIVCYCELGNFQTISKQVLSPSVYHHYGLKFRQLFFTYPETRSCDSRSSVIQVSDDYNKNG